MSLPPPHELTPAEARRVAVRGQLLDADRPDDALEVARHLTVLQLDQTAHVAPSADLVLWSRIGAGYDPGELTDLLESFRLVDLRGMARPEEHMALLRAEMAAWPSPGDLTEGEQALLAWVEDNDACRRDILERLRMDGPLRAVDLPDTCVRPWRSSGWTDGKNVQRMVDLMVQRGEVATAGREGQHRLWDLAERIYPDDPVPAYDDALARRDQLRLRALGIARSRSQLVPGEANHVAMAGEPARVSGVRGGWRVDPQVLAEVRAGFAGRIALLSPLDRLLFDRRRMAELFGFDYQLEMYKPAAKRRFGYWAMPVLSGDRLVGKLDAAADRGEGALVVTALHEDEPFDAATRDGVRAEVEALGAWLGLDVIWPG